MNFGTASPQTRFREQMVIMLSAMVVSQCDSSAERGLLTRR